VKAYIHMCSRAFPGDARVPRDISLSFAFVLPLSAPPQTSLQALLQHKHYVANEGSYNSMPHTPPRTMHWPHRSRLSEELPENPSWLPSPPYYNAQNSPSQPPSMSPNPMPRQSGVPKWSHGVLSGGVVIDMLECLSMTTRTTDYELILWLQAHYIEPFGRIERLDGLVVTEEKHM
jgi:hypothetical protein